MFSYIFEILKLKTGKTNFHVALRRTLIPLFFIAPVTSSAEVVDGTFRATVSTVTVSPTSPLPTPISIGDEVFGTFSYDTVNNIATDISSSVVGEGVRYFFPDGRPTNGYDITINGYTWSTQGTNFSVTVVNSDETTVPEAPGNVTDQLSIGRGGLFVNLQEIRVAGTTTSFLNSTELPNEFLDLDLSTVNNPTGQIFEGYFIQFIVDVSSFQLNGETAVIAFPIIGFGPYDNPVTSVMDHDGSTPHLENGRILAFDGTSAECMAGFVLQAGNGKCKDGSTGNSNKDDVGKSRKTKVTCEELEDAVCTRKGIFSFLSLDASPLSSINYVELAGSGYVSYDGHPGYDFDGATGDLIQAAADGTLCAVSRLTEQPIDGGIWRNPSKCPFGIDEVNGGQPDGWTNYHSFYIIDEGGEYSYWYLHSDNLAPQIDADIRANGFAVVEKYDEVSFLGKKGAGGSHLHFEVRDENNNPIDPYGGIGQPALWEE